MSHSEEMLGNRYGMVPALKHYRVLAQVAYLPDTASYQPKRSNRPPGLTSILCQINHAVDVAPPLCPQMPLKSHRRV